MDLLSTEIYKVLTKKGVEYLHHANTVTTAKSYIIQGALLSREKVDQLGLDQTPQSSDDKDKRFGINDFLFFDGLDLSDYFKRPNEYGPVLFKFSLNILLREDIPTVRIARVNPIYWDRTSEDQRHYKSVDDFDKHFKSGDRYLDGSSCIMITTTNGILPFLDGLLEIVIDDPDLVINGKTEIDSIKDILFPNVQEFKQKYPHIQVFKTPRNSERIKNLSLKEYIKRYKKETNRLS
jgi:hypothetical protein